MQMLETFQDTTENSHRLVGLYLPLSMDFLSQQFSTEVVGDIVLAFTLLTLNRTTANIADDILMFDFLTVRYLEHLASIRIYQFLRHSFGDEYFHEERIVVLVFHTVCLGVEVLLDEALHRVHVYLLTSC